MFRGYRKGGARGDGLQRPLPTSLIAQGLHFDRKLSQRLTNPPHQECGPGSSSLGKAGNCQKCRVLGITPASPGKSASGWHSRDTALDLRSWRALPQPSEQMHLPRLHPAPQPCPNTAPKFTLLLPTRCPDDSSSSGRVSAKLSINTTGIFVFSK